MKMLPADDAEMLRRDWRRVALHGLEQLANSSSIDPFLSEEAAQREARGADLGEDRLLLLRAAQATKLGDELANRPVLPEMPVARDVRRQVALQASLGVPMRAGRIAGAPFRPVGVGRLDVDEIGAVPRAAQRQVRIEPNVTLGERLEAFPWRGPAMGHSRRRLVGHLIVIRVPMVIGDGAVVCVMRGSLVT